MLYALYLNLSLMIYFIGKKLKLKKWQHCCRTQERLAGSILEPEDVHARTLSDYVSPSAAACRQHGFYLKDMFRFVTLQIIKVLWIKGFFWHRKIKQEETTH